MKKLLALLAVVLTLTSCGSLTPEQLTPEQIRCMKESMATDLSFIIPADSLEVVWGRGYKFLRNYCQMKIQQANDYTVETYNADATSSTSTKYAYQFSKLKVGADKYEITVSGNTNVSMSMFNFDSWLQENLHIMARYMKTGEICPEMLDKKYYQPQLRKQFSN